MKGSSRKSLGFHDQPVLLNWLRWRKSQLLQTLTDMMKGDDEVLAIRVYVCRRREKVVTGKEGGDGYVRRRWWW